MRISRDKANKVAHVVTDALATIDELDFLEDRNTIRLEVRKIMEDLLNQEAKIDQAARAKIESQKRTILEAYSDEMNRSGANYQEMFRKVKNELVRKYKAVL